MNNTTYQTQKSTVKVEKKESEGIVSKKRAYVKRLTDSFQPKGGFRCF